MSMTELLTQMRDLAAGVVSEAQRSTVHVPIDDLAAEIAAMQQVIASVTAAPRCRQHPRDVGAGEICTQPSHLLPHS